MNNDRGLEANGLDSEGWATDRDLWGLDVWQMRHAKPVAHGPVRWNGGPGSSAITEVTDQEHLAVLLAALESGDVGTAARESVHVRATGVAHAGPSALVVIDLLGDAPDGAPRRVFRGLREQSYRDGLIQARGYKEAEVFDAATAAQLVWSALTVGLPVGYSTTVLPED